MVNKNGVSAIVATVLIILITVAAIGIIWAVIIPMIKSGVEVEDFDARLEVVTQGGYTFYDEENGQLHIQVSRGVDEADMTGVRIIVVIDGTSTIYPNLTAFPDDAFEVPEVNGKKTYIINMDVKPDSVRVVVLTSDGNGESSGSSSSDVAVTSGSSSGGSSPQTETRDGNDPSGNDPECDVSIPCEDGFKCVSGSCVVEVLTQGTINQVWDTAWFNFAEGDAGMYSYVRFEGSDCVADESCQEVTDESLFSCMGSAPCSKVSSGTFSFSSLTSCNGDTFYTYKTMSACLDSMS